MYRCLIVTMGGDAPGVNAAIRAVTRIGLQSQGWKVMAARRGIPGLLAGAVRDLSEKEIRFILERGGSILGTSAIRIPPSDEEAIRKIARALQEYDVVIAAGGMGSFSILNQVYQLNEMGVTTTMFIPSSIENEFIQPTGRPGRPDIHAQCIGADTAANAGVAIIDRLRDQSYLNQTVFLVQCVGVKSNYLPLAIGLGCGAHRIYLGDYPPLTEEEAHEIQSLSGGRFHPNRLETMEFVGWIQEMFFSVKKSYLVVIVPNGMTTIDYGRGHRKTYEEMVRATEPMGFSLLRLVEEMEVHFADHPEVQIRSVSLDDLQRGGAPTVRDRLLGTLYGVAAVEEFLQIANTQDTQRRGNLNLLAVRDVDSGTWACHPREEVAPLFQGPDAAPGGLPALSFYRQGLGLLSGYRPLAEL